MRSTYRICRVCGDMHNVAEWPDNHRELPPARADQWAGIMVIRDSMEHMVEGPHRVGLDGIQSQIDGKYYTSKRRMRAEYRGHGVEELGNDKPKPFKKPGPDKKKLKADVRRAWSRAGLGAL